MTAKNINTELTYELAHELLSADFETGILVWKKRDRKLFTTDRIYNSWNTRFADKKAGAEFINNYGKRYHRLNIFNISYATHRVLWLMCNKVWPNQIDHIDGNGLNNRQHNLRSVSNQENGKNQRKRSNNTSGCTGVSWTKSNKKWCSRIRVNNKLIHIGYYTDWFEAVCARKSAERKYNFHFNHGQIRDL